jgi:putative ABC transport system permease protein
MALPLSYNIRSLKVRWQVTLLSVTGIAVVVAVLAVLLMMSSGFQHALRSTGRTDNAILVQRGSASEMTSAVPLAHRQLIEVDSRVARGDDGQPLSSPEIVVVTNMPRRVDGQAANVTVRGVTDRAFLVRGGIEIVSGRQFTPGLYEIIVGERIAARMSGLDIGDSIEIQSEQWQVVGTFASQGGAFESEIWGDFHVMGPAFGRTGGSSSVALRLSAPETRAAFDKEIRSNPDMQLQLVEERQYYEDQAGPVVATLVGLAIFVSIVMGIGAVFGAMNTMYAIVAARTREIGTLRAIGFTRQSVRLAFVLESLLLAMVGGLLGCALALPMSGFTSGTGAANFAEVAFAFQFTPTILIVALGFALFMGALGGLLPAYRASRLPITSALRES